MEKLYKIGYYITVWYATFESFIINHKSGFEGGIIMDKKYIEDLRPMSKSSHSIIQLIVVKEGFYEKE